MLAVPVRHLQFIRPAQQICRSSTNTSPAPAAELVYPESQSPHHNSLPSFLEYTSRTGLDPTSSTYIGTHYEYTVQTSLCRLGLSLQRIGGRSDHGIDLLGVWPLPSAPHPMKVLVQCKAFKEKLSPSLARELEGSFVGAPSGWRGNGVLGLLVSQKSATKGVREAMGRSRWPMGYVLVTREGKVLQMLWNRRAEVEGLEGVGVGLKYGGGESGEREVVLTWKGEALGA
ncbi:uncharacterized protein L3040_002129 [Drepanopeziza brunnea f. sp. 'multigermtubi']|uniref:Conserved fungal protein n=1 Tax=Marssonina brunnea f. sp. multigermtubi (strain MB_m1) TaxID=1072389 RepID=K1X140_MARBU|nr:uncharacterized protein MBM_02944 [Drepanopeziza brunnea f. sp. 'multigermtubi' MB_m1]EKD18702.1 conserved fungal protein [Drepanopeziza brunnea f. sp. 'multigermtubi' MB_m1]KAJ5052378.1 hypothetical protein L3040_002129 [Drepanopeziza brunnea f. sp. 'multigermtubi']